MKFDRSSFFLLIISFLGIGILLGIVTKITKIPTFWPSVAMLLIYTIVYNRNAFTKPSVLLSFLLYLVLQIYSSIGYFKNIPDVHIERFGIFSLVHYFFISALIIENIILLKNRQENVIKIGKFIFIIFIIGSIINVYSEILFPGVTRHSFQNVDSKVFIWTFSFGAINVIPFVMAAFLASFKGKKIYLILISSLFFITLVLGGLMTALIISVFSSIVGIMLRNNYKKIFNVVVGIIILILTIMYNIESIVTFLPDLPNEIYQIKAKQIIEMSQSKNSSELIGSSRQGVYQISIDAIKSNYLFGTGDFREVGEHSFFLDKIGVIGIFGTFFYIILLYYIFKRSLLILKNDEKIIFRYLIMILFFLLFLNPYEYNDFWIIFIGFLPSLIIYFNQVKGKKDI